MITLKQVDEMVADRPEKFSAEDVGFSPTSDNASQTCGSCYRLYSSPIARRAVCEIYAPETEDRNVPAEATCAFWTPDGVEHPRLKAKPKKQKSEPENKKHTVG